MTQTFAVNDNNDIFINNTGNLSIVFGLTAVLQVCEQYAKALLGEMVLNTNLGIPYFQTVFNGVPNLQQYTAALRLAFLTVPDVLEVVSLITGQTGSTLSYTAIIRTIYGSGGISG